jgi:murein DD-endopeptidase MepM/ murein hydrolase activator NlpD
LKRALKEKVKAVLENPPSDDAPVEQLNVVNPYINRQKRTKAAMIGLAISMGATSLLVTRQGDQAQAAAPVGNQNTASTIPAAPNTEVKFAPIQKLQYQAVSSVSVPETPRIVQPTAISQVPELQAKLQVAAPVVMTTGTIQQSVNFQPKVAQKVSIPKSYANEQSDRSGIAGVQSISLNAQPQTLVSAASSTSEVNPELRAQQEFAINRLQEKSNRLRRSLAEWRSEETKLSQATNSVAPTAVEKTPQLNANNTALKQSKNATDASQVSLVSRLKQAKVGNAASKPVPAPRAAINVPVAPSGLRGYEVKPGDTLATIASDHGTSVSEIIKANNLNNPNELRINQKLTVPAAENRTNATVPSVAAVTPMQPSSAPEIATQSRNTFSADLTATELQQPSVTANNSVTIPTAIISDNQIQATAIKPTTDLTTAPAYGIGGDSPIPQNFNQMQLAKKPPEVTRAKNNNPRLRSLQDEIEKLRTKYRAQQSGNVIVPTESASNEAAVTIPVSEPNNFAVSNPVSRVNNVAVPIPVPRPMAPNYSAQTVQPQFRPTQPTNDAVNPDFFFINQTSRQLNPSGNRPSVRIATPPVGVDASASLGAMRGRTVSPDLPPLTAAVDRYLPRAIDPTMPAPSTMTTAYIWPAKGVLTSGFGQRWGRPHRGIDVANGTGTPIYASADGVIEKAGWNNGGYGNVVDIRHNDGSMTRYGHNSKILVQAGQPVRQGDTIALMGSTGFSTGPHSHFEIHPSGKGAVNPIALLPPRM